MDKYVVSKTTAEKLKKVGFPQTTEWYWVWDAFQNDNLLKQYFSAYVTGKVDQKYPKNDNWIAAPIAEEILKELKNGIYILCAGGGGKIVDYVVGENFSTRELWSIALAKGFHRDTTPFELRDKNLSEGLAKMYIYLKKNNLI